jgi:hypothetical protein
MSIMAYSASDRPFALIANALMGTDAVEDVFFYPRLTKMANFML